MVHIIHNVSWDDCLRKVSLQWDLKTKFNAVEV